MSKFFSTKLKSQKLDSMTLSPSMVITETPQEALNSSKCENCAKKFGITKQKKICLFCKYSYCRDCVHDCCRLVYGISHNSSRVTRTHAQVKACSKCELMSSTHASLDDLMKIEIRYLKAYLVNKNQSLLGHKEKSDLAEHIRFLNRNELAENERPVSADQARTARNSYQTNCMNAACAATVSRQLAAESSAVSSRSLSATSSMSTSPSPSARHAQQSDAQTPVNNDNTYTNNNRSSTTTTTTNDERALTSDEISARLNSIGVSLMNENDERARLPEVESISEPIPVISTRKRRASLSDLTCMDDIDKLTNLQLKEILAFNFVDYKGCLEKSDLIAKVKLLYESNEKAQKQLTQENSTTTGVVDADTVSGGTSNNSSGSNGGVTSSSELCKICMDKTIECVLLNCGHMVSCVTCGKQLAECPICRQNIVKVVRVFKA